MASIMLKCVKNNNSINLMNRLLAVNGKTRSGVMCLSSDESKQLKKYEWEPVDQVTHTGQSFTPDDYRMVRFVGKQKQINPSFAIDLIAEVPPIASTERVVSCNGGGGPLGHPKVFINLDQPGNHSCGYCGLRFYKEDTHH